MCTDLHKYTFKFEDIYYENTYVLIYMKTTVLSRIFLAGFHNSCVQFPTESKSASNAETHSRRRLFFRYATSCHKSRSIKRLSVPRLCHDLHSVHKSYSVLGIMYCNAHSPPPRNTINNVFKESTSSLVAKYKYNLQWEKSRSSEAVHSVWTSFLISQNIS